MSIFAFVMSEVVVPDFTTKASALQRKLEGKRKKPFSPTGSSG